MKSMCNMSFQSAGFKCSLTVPCYSDFDQNILSVGVAADVVVGHHNGVGSCLRDEMLRGGFVNECDEHVLTADTVDGCSTSDLVEGEVGVFADVVREFGHAVGFGVEVVEVVDGVSPGVGDVVPLKGVKGMEAVAISNGDDREEHEKHNRIDHFWVKFVFYFSGFLVAECW